MSMALSNSNNADRVDPGSLPSGIRSFLGHVHIYERCCTEAEYRSGILSLKPVG